MEDDDCVHWDDQAQTLEYIKAMLEKTKEAALTRERALACAFSHQVRLKLVDNSTHATSSFS